jgi:hypothetical protein
MNHQYAIMWDCHGLEAVQKVPDPADTTFAILAKKPLPQLPNLMHWQLRARANSQRHYEIYIVNVTDGITEDDIRDMFEASPQMAADTIRRLGTVFHSDRAQEDRVVIR